MANKHNKSLILWVIGEIQKQTLKKYHFTPTRMAKLRNLTIPSDDECIEQWELTVGGSINLKPIWLLHHLAYD